MAEVETGRLYRQGVRVPNATRKAIVEEYLDGEATYEELAFKYGVSAPSVGRFLREHYMREKAKEEAA